MGRFRGYWWSPDGTRLLVARVNESNVRRWHIADPANPDRRPAEVGYPAAGTPNADVSLFIADLAAGTRTTVEWDNIAFPYLVNAAWDDDLLIVVQTRDQKAMRLFNGITGEVIREDTDPHWTDIIDGTPAQLRNGRHRLDRTQRRHPAADRRPRGGPGQCRAAHPARPAGARHPRHRRRQRAVQRLDGANRDRGMALRPRRPDRGGHRSRRAHRANGGPTTVVSGRTLRGNHVSVRINKKGKPARDIAVLAEEPNLPHPDPQFLDAGAGDIRTAVLFPSWHRPGTKLPVLMDPYGGPHSQRVLKTASAFLASQWFAEQGFAVVVADGRGTPGRGPAWDRMVAGDFATGVLEDQVTALHAAAEKFADLDASRVGIRGWSFGGYLAALAVLRRPDVFGAAVAGAPVTDWRLYDTHYTERYLGDPAANPAAYEVSSLNDDPERAVATAVRPLLIIHGLADDNVFVAHSLRLSSALLAAGYPHSVLPLSGVTHMTPQEVVAENLLLLQVAFLRDALSRQGV